MYQFFGFLLYFHGRVHVCVHGVHGRVYVYVHARMYGHADLLNPITQSSNERFWEDNFSFKEDKKCD